MGGGRPGGTPTTMHPRGCTPTTMHPQAASRGWGWGGASPRSGPVRPLSGAEALPPPQSQSPFDRLMNRMINPVALAITSQRYLLTRLIVLYEQPNQPACTPLHPPAPLYFSMFFPSIYPLLLKVIVYHMKPKKHAR